MRETTQQRQVEGPAVVFSEKGLQIFLDFMVKVTGATPAPDLFKESPGEVDEFLQGWRQSNAAEKSKGRVRATRKRYSDRFSKEFQALEIVMKDEGEMMLADIVKRMGVLGFWEDKPRKNWASLMINHIRRNPERLIPKGGGVYEMIEQPEGAANNET